MGLIELIIVILLIMWLLGYFVFSIGALLHFLLIIAAVLLIFRVIRRV